MEKVFTLTSYLENLTKDSGPMVRKMEKVSLFLVVVMLT